MYLQNMPVSAQPQVQASHQVQLPQVMVPVYAMPPPNHFQHHHQVQYLQQVAGQPMPTISHAPPQPFLPPGAGMDGMTAEHPGPKPPVAASVEHDLSAQVSQAINFLATLSPDEVVWMQNKLQDLLARHQQHLGQVATSCVAGSQQQQSQPQQAYAGQSATPANPSALRQQQQQAHQFMMAQRIQQRQELQQQRSMQQVPSQFGYPIQGYPPQPVFYSMQAPASTLSSHVSLDSQATQPKLSHVGKDSSSIAVQQSATKTCKTGGPAVTAVAATTGDNDSKKRSSSSLAKRSIEDAVVPSKRAKTVSSGSPNRKKAVQARQQGQKSASKQSRKRKASPSQARSSQGSPSPMTVPTSKQSSTTTSPTLSSTADASPRTVSNSPISNASDSGLDILCNAVDIVKPKTDTSESSAPSIRSQVVPSQ